MTGRKYDKPLSISMGFDEALKRVAQTKPEEITSNANKISRLAPRMASKEITSNQPQLALAAEREVEGIGMGVLSDGTPYLNQRGLSVLCGVQNAHIGTISAQWNEPEQKPRIAAISAIVPAQIAGPTG